jgi:hypothetical protein
MKTITDYWRDAARDWDESSYTGGTGRGGIVERIATRFRAHIRARHETAVRIVGGWIAGRTFVEIGMGGGELLTRLLELGALQIVDAAKRRVTDAGVADRAELLVGTIDRLDDVPAPSIVVGLGIIEYLRPQEVIDVLRQLRPEHVFLSFDERTLNGQKAMHYIYRRLKRFPSYKQYRPAEAQALLADAGYPDARVLHEHSNSFVTTLPLG